MIAEAIAILFAKQKEADNPTPHVRKIGPRQIAVTISGETTVEEVPKPLIDRTASDLASLVMLTEAFRGEAATAYVSDSSIEVFLDDSDRLENVYLRLSKSDQLIELERIARGVDQKELVKSMRTILADACTDQDFLAIVRHVQFDTMRENRGSVANTSQSMGRKVEKAVKAKAGTIPETITLRLPYFQPLGVNVTVQIECCVHIDIDTETLSLIPVGSELDAAKLQAQNAIKDRLSEDLNDEILIVSGRADTH